MATTAKKVTKSTKSATKTTAKKTGKVGTAKFADTAKITVLEKGKTNPRRPKTGPYNRYEALKKSRTVADFLKVQPKWRATINRAVKEGFIKVSA
jgi:hypothetical protein